MLAGSFVSFMRWLITLQLVHRRQAAAAAAQSTRPKSSSKLAKPHEVANPMAKPPPVAPRSGPSSFTQKLGLDDAEWAIPKRELQLHEMVAAGAAGGLGLCIHVRIPTALTAFTPSHRPSLPRHLWLGAGRRQGALCHLRRRQGRGEFCRHNSRPSLPLAQTCTPQAASAEFRKECSVLAELRHPNVLKFYGICIDEATLYMVMEWCDTSLARYIRKLDDSVPPSTWFWTFAQQLATGIAYLHRRGIAHRDIKPENMLLDEQERRVKVADFGLSKTMQTLAGTTEIGTPLFMAPELGEEQRYDASKVRARRGAMRSVVLCKMFKPLRSRWQRAGRRVCNRDDFVVDVEPWSARARAESCDAAFCRQRRVAPRNPPGRACPPCSIDQALLGCRRGAKAHCRGGQGGADGNGRVGYRGGGGHGVRESCVKMRSGGICLAGGSRVVAHAHGVGPVAPRCLSRLRFRCVHSAVESNTHPMQGRRVLRRHSSNTPWLLHEAPTPLEHTCARQQTSRALPANTADE